MLIISTDGIAVYPLWNGKVETAIKEFSKVRNTLSRNMGVAAVLPGQLLDLNEMDLLEEHGLLVIEVPYNMKDVSAINLADFIDQQVACI